MKIEHIQEYVVPTIALAVGLGVALGCGLMIGQGDTKLPLLIVAAFAVMSFLLVVQEKIWVLIPATAMLGGKIVALPVPFTVAHIGILIAFGMYMILKARKIVRLKPKNGIVEVWMWIMLVYMFVTYVRNPVGVEAFGSDRVGGKPYVDIIIAYLGFWVLGRSTASVRESYLIIFLGFMGNACLAFVNFVAFRFPSTTAPLANLYSGIAAAESAEGATAVDEGGRLSYLGGVGGNLVATACSFWHPFTLVNPMHFWRFAMFFAGLIAVLLSGFRSGLFGMFEIFLLASFFRGGIGDVVRAAALMVVALAFLVGMQGNIVNLPFPAQRALSFLPGKWDYGAKSEAEGSTEWRVEMWKVMLDGNKYIENKWLGDGYGFTHRQLEIMASNQFSGSNADQQENLMISGGVHSGPVSSIRFVGYIGLAIFLALLGLVAWRSIRLVQRARGTPLFPLVLLGTIPSIALPFNFIFIFGAFDADLPNVVITIGFQKMLENSLNAYFAGTEKAAPEVIQPPKFRPIAEFAPAGRK
ncbi:MAG: hypothetical protein ABJF10_05370 [Chthoniobacter sp.]|uniref:hypothetical protein n=1 Tax=Chthoniobacter sp. TaxID=2510640 RepID=UPI0032AB0A2A